MPQHQSRLEFRLRIGEAGRVPNEFDGVSIDYGINSSISWTIKIRTCIPCITNSMMAVAN
jgi:hypothetical protein